MSEQNLIEKMIANNDMNLSLVLDNLNFGSFDESIFIKFMEVYLRTCYNYNNIDMVKLFFNKIPFYATINGSYEDGNYIGTDTVIDLRETKNTSSPTIMTKLLLLPNMDENIITIVQKTYSDTYNSLFVLSELCKLPNTELVVPATMKFIKVVGEIDNDTLNIVLNLADKYDSNYLYNYFTTFIKKYAKLPEYMDNKYSDIYENKLDLPNIENVLTDLINKIKNMYDSDKVDNILNEIIYSLKYNLYDDLADKLKKSLSENDMEKMYEIFRILGPCNPNLNEDDDVYSYQDYMFYSRKVAEDDDDYNNFNYNNDWFTGQCKYCSLLIEKRYYAVRKPLIHGYWIGCYCSWKCVVSDLSYERKSLPLEDEDLNNKFYQMYNKVLYYDKIMNKLKIYDRKLVK